MPPDSVAPALALRVNGEALQSRAATLAELLVERGLDGAQGGFACALNGCFVPRARWASQPLAGGDSVEIVAPVVGG